MARAEVPSIPYGELVEYHLHRASLAAVGKDPNEYYNPGMTCEQRAHWDMLHFAVSASREGLTRNIVYVDDLANNSYSLYVEPATHTEGTQRIQELIHKLDRNISELQEMGWGGIADISLVSFLGPAEKFVEGLKKPGIIFFRPEGTKQAIIMIK